MCVCVCMYLYKQNIALNKLQLLVCHKNLTKYKEKHKEKPYLHYVILKIRQFYLTVRVSQCEIF